MRPNLEYKGIFKSSVSTFISSKKYTKSDMQKIWKRNFINYIKISKYLRV